MALATKCPHCNTIFRVAHDQLKLRGGIVRCGACNEVFDGNAALVDPTPKQPVIIDIPAASPTPATFPELDALISTLDTIHAGEARTVSPARAMEPEPEPEPELEPSAETGPEPVLRLDLADPGLEAAAPADDAFDLDLDVEPEPEDALSIGEEPASATVPPWEDAAPARGTLPWEDEAAPASLEDALVLDVEPEDDTPRREAEGPHSAWPYASHDADNASATRATHDMDAAFDASPVSHAYDGRLEPTLDIPDEHLTAVALHDSFELDAYPHPDDEQRDGAQDGAIGQPPAVDNGELDEDGESGGEKDDEEDHGHVVTLSGDTALAAALDGADRDGADLGPDAADDMPVSAHAPEEPGFVKRSRRRERFGKAGRVLMICAIPLLLAGIAAQVVGTFRNPLAAVVPALKPALVSACALAGCKVELPAQIDALSIEQGELQTMADNVFSFTTSLRNQSASAQAWPHIELILNDGADQPVLRRVFAPREYLPSPADVEKGFSPRSEQSVKLFFELAQVKASGYHIAVFYP